MEDKRIEKTKNDLKKAILEIIKEKNINLVSVSELCSKASINRNTFYCHYHYPQEVLEEIFNDFLLSLLSFSKPGGNSYSTVKASCDFIKKNRELVIILTSDNSNGIFEKKLNKNVYERNMKNLKTEKGPYNSKYYNYISVFLFNGSISIMKEWVNNGFIESSEEIANLISELCNYGTHKNKF